MAVSVREKKSGSQALISRQKRQISEKLKAMPDFLIYEKLEGKPIYYKNYQFVLQGSKTLEDIMGSGKLQARIVSVLLRYLFASLPTEDFEILTNETGLHLGERDNVASDITIFDKKQLDVLPNEDKYISIAPLAVIEVDTQADTSGFTSSEDYYYIKTQKLLDFGVKEVIWYLSHSRKVIVARQNQDWLVMDWQKEVTLLENYSFSLVALLNKSGINF
jgi:Uma2 family endonuclease